MENHMQVIVSEKMKEWVAGYIRSHRKEGTISIHVVYSKFNEDFRKTFKADPQVAIRLLQESGFLKGCPTIGGYSIWLAEDAGKGKRRPYRSRTPQDNGATAVAVAETLSTSTTEQADIGEIEMNDVSIEPHYVFEKIPHPETGKVDVLEILRYIMKQFDKLLPDESEMDGPYFVIKMGIYGVFKDAGISSGSWSELSRIMREMSLIKHYGRSQWGVLKGDVADYFITARSYLVAKEAMMERHRRNRKILHLEKALEKLSVSTAEVGSDTTQSAGTSSGYSEDDVLQLMAEVDDLTKALDTVKQQMAELQTKCDGLTTERDKLAAENAARPSSVDVVKQMIEERLAAARKARQS